MDQTSDNVGCFDVGLTDVNNELEVLLDRQMEQ